MTIVSVDGLMALEMVVVKVEHLTLSQTHWNFIPLMSLQVVNADKRFLADIAGVWPLSSVSSLMLLQESPVIEGLWAEAALEWFLL